MGGRGGRKKPFWGEKGKIYLFTFDTYHDGIYYGNNQMLAEGGKQPTEIIKEVTGDGGAVTNNWYSHGFGATFGSRMIATENGFEYRSGWIITERRTYIGSNSAIWGVQEITYQNWDVKLYPTESPIISYFYLN